MKDGREYEALEETYGLKGTKVREKDSEGFSDASERRFVRRKEEEKRKS